MNLELNVVRFENEDVIATSGLCSHISATSGDDYGHLYVTNREEATPAGLKFDPTEDNKSLVNEGTIGSYYDARDLLEINKNGW